MKKSNPNLCSIKGCYEQGYLVYYGHMVCLKHWLKHTEKPFLKQSLNILEEPIKSVVEPLKCDLKGYLNE